MANVLTRPLSESCNVYEIAPRTSDAITDEAVTTMEVRRVRSPKANHATPVNDRSSSWATVGLRPMSGNLIYLITSDQSVRSSTFVSAGAMHRRPIADHQHIIRPGRTTWGREQRA
jgi:hypothetical protein